MLAAEAVELSTAAAVPMCAAVAHEMPKALQRRPPAQPHFQVSELHTCGHVRVRISWYALARLSAIAGRAIRLKGDSPLLCRVVTAASAAGPCLPSPIGKPSGSIGRLMSQAHSEEQGNKKPQEEDEELALAVSKELKQQRRASSKVRQQTSMLGSAAH